MDAIDYNIEAGDTIRYYNERAEEFAQNTAEACPTESLRAFTDLLPDDGLVLDWGCGTGRDSRVLLNQGFLVVSTDASQTMCNLAHDLFRVRANCETFGELNAVCKYDGIWACASLLHVKLTRLPILLQKAHKALKPKGVLYASFKLGNFQGMRDGRWYTDLDEPLLKQLVSPLFDIERVWVSNDVRPACAHEQWLNCLLRKRM